MLRSGEAQEWTLPVALGIALACVIFMLTSALIGNGMHDAHVYFSDNYHWNKR